MNAEIPDNVIVLRELAMIEMKTNRFEAAEAHFTRMIDLNSAAGSPDFNLFATRGWIRVFSFGKESLATQDLEVAEQHFDEISKANQERTLQGLANLSPLRNLVKTKAYAQRAVDLFQSSWAQQLLSLIEKYEEEQKKPLNRK